MSASKVIIIDDHPIVCATINLLFNKDDAINVILQLDKGISVIEYLKDNDADLLILDIELPDMDGFEILRYVQALGRKTKVLFLSAKSENIYASRAIQAGANGFISKQKPLEEIYNAAKIILAGYSFFPANLLEKITNHRTEKDDDSDAVQLLSNRELTVLRHLAHGRSNKETADILNLSNKTVSTHKSNIFLKLGIHSIIELSDYAKENNLI